MTRRYLRSTFVEDQSEFVEHLQNGKQIGKLLDMPKRPQAPTLFFLGGTYNSLNSTFKIDFKKGLDSEDADRRDSINRLNFSSFVERMRGYIINRIFPCEMARPRKV